MGGDARWDEGGRDTQQNEVGMHNDMGLYNEIGCARWHGGIR